ncbi:MAG: hypothetical protein QOD41_3649 [Cryptosporangiaceae bacterium]|nr:hypothetical protein [Cryptosporangiaceae bacterium]
MTAVAVAAALVALVGLPRPSAVRDAVEHAGALGSALVIGGCALLTLAMAPRAAIAALGGLVFGTTEAMAYVLTGAVLGASLSFLAGRVLGRDGVRRWAGHRWVKIDAWIDGNGFVTVVCARLLPLVPFGLLNYGLGTTTLRLRTFALATALGIAPSTLVYVISGRWAATDPALGFAVTAVFTTVTLLIAAAIRYRTVAAYSRALAGRLRRR